MGMQYPLEWPTGWQRTEPHLRRRARYTVSQNRAQVELIRELARMDPGNKGWAVISTNLPIRRDGLPYSKLPRIDDPGVAVYFLHDDEQHVIACDRWDLIKDNIRAIGLSIAALRLIDRSGASQIIERAYSGFQALPTGAADWRNVLQLGNGSADLNAAREAYMRLRKRHHPDHGGDPNEFHKIQEAWRRCREELGAES